MSATRAWTLLLLLPVTAVMMSLLAPLPTSAQDAPDLCGNSTCSNGGTCLNDTCVCTPNFTDASCSTPLWTNCSSSPCQNGGTCLDFDGGFNCTCPEGTTGTSCETKLDACDSSPCGNGTCQPENNNYTCNCMPGFTGRNCLTKIDHCARADCGRGTCINMEHNFTCQCPPDYTGRLCKKEVDPCASVDCGRGNCTREGRNFTCHCPADYTGRLCKAKIGDSSDGENRTTGPPGQGYKVGRDSNCDRATKDCPPSLWDPPPRDVNLPAIVGGCIAAFVVVVIIIVVVILLIRYCQRRARTQGKQFTLIGNHSDNVLSIDELAEVPASMPELEGQGVGAQNHRERALPQVPISREQLPAVVAEARGDLDYFKAEFEQLPKGLQYPVTVAMNEHNKGKNRYRSICAYDHSRVVLSKVAGKPHSDYINACYLHGYKMKKAFIASQGPNDVNIEDFLRMIWEKDVEKIAMLTKPTEMGQMKCVQYWNDLGEVQFGSFTVRVQAVTEKVDMGIRHLSIQPTGGVAKLVTHFLFKTWPDKTVPESPWALTDFREKLLTSRSKGRAPILVHCSAGVGRTGTLVALDVVLRQLLEEEGEEGGQVDFLHTVATLRKDRMDLVQTLAQYTFLHEAALVGLCSAGRVVPIEVFASDSVARDKAKIEEEFKAVQACTHPLSPEDCTLGDSPDHHFANRSQDILPHDKHVVWLNEPMEDEIDYINAVYVPSYVEAKRYVLTQTPLPDTVVNFWRMVFEADVKTIVSLDTSRPDPKTGVGEYVPVNKSVLQVGPVTLTLQQTQKHHGYIQRTIEAALEGEEARRTVQQFQAAKLWPKGMEVPSDPGQLLELVRKVLSFTPPGEGRILVHCREGGRRSGVYVALSSLLERSSSEGEVAVPYVVGVLASIRPQALPFKEQYAFLYATMLHHVDNDLVYENIASTKSHHGNYREDENIYMNA